jgi:Leucine-rich repeat (LRR) protein
MKTKFIAFQLALILCVTINTTHAQVSVQDSSALVDLYNSTNGVHWKNHTNWLTANPVSTWFGIRVSNGRVTKIILNNNMLKGAIPSSVGNLTNLDKLVLSNNQLSGSIPSTLFTLINLQWLDLFRNRLSGTIPASIGNLVNLTALYLGQNQLTGNIPGSIGNLVKLHENLDLDYNQLSGSIPSSIGNLKKLNYLYLDNNQLTGNIPYSIGNMSALAGLVINDNKLSGPIPSSIKNLNLFTENEGWLYMERNQFTFEGMQLVASTFPDATYAPQANIPLNRKNNTLSVSTGGTLSNNTYKWFKDNVLVATFKGDSVFHLSQTGNYFAEVTNDIATQLTLYTDTIFFGATHDVVQDSLALVDLYNSTKGPQWNNHTNWLTGKPVSTWYGITVTNARVTGISLQSNGLNGIIPPSIDYLEKLSNLRLDHNNLHGSIPVTFGNLPHSLPMNLSHNNFTFDGMELIAQTFPNAVYAPQRLIAIHQNGNTLSVSAGGTLGNNTFRWFNLKQKDSVINVGDSVFHASTTGHYFAKITNAICTQLTLYTDTVYYDATHAIEDSLVLVDLYNSTNGANWENHTNWLSKKPFSTWAGIQAPNGRVTGIDLYDNNLKGNLPASLGNLTRLNYLVLSYNELNGRIPASIGHLINIQQIWLDNNQLNGEIPASIGNLTNLGDLWLNNNQLSGKIPASMGNLVNIDVIISGEIILSDNQFTFDGMELIAQKFPNASLYAPQKNIPLHQNGNTLSVSAGGTLSNNTYKWFKDNALIATITGDSVFHPTASGVYFVKILNSLATQLKLNSNTINYTAPNNSIIVSANSQLQHYSKTNVFRLYPNPAKDILHVETNNSASFSLINQSGKILLTTNINGKGSINVSGIDAGLYYLKNNSTNAVQKVVIAR